MLTRSVKCQLTRVACGWQRLLSARADASNTSSAAPAPEKKAVDSDKKSTGPGAGKKP
jgi:hypothetical protein